MQNDFEIVSKPGKDHTNADAWSCRIYSIQSDIIISNDTNKEFISIQENDPELIPLIMFLENNALRTDDNQESSIFLNTCKILFRHSNSQPLSS